MAKLQVPSNVTSITIGGVAKVPDVNSEVTVTDVEMAVLAPQQFQPRVIIASQVSGDVTIQLPAGVTSITIDAVVYNVNGSNQIVVPAVRASLFMRSLHGRPFIYARA